MGLIAIVTTLFLTGRIVARFGLKAGLLTMPLLVTVLMIVLALGGALGMSDVQLFWIAAVAKTVNVALGFSLSQATGILLYQPLLGHQRHRTETIAEGIMQPLAFGVAGLLLLPFATTLHFGAVRLSLLFLPIAGLWLWVILRISASYPKVVSEALQKRSLGESTTLLFDPAGLAQLENRLESPRAGQWFYTRSTNLSSWSRARGKHTFLGRLPSLLAHPVAEVRQEALRPLSSGLGSRRRSPSSTAGCNRSSLPASTPC